MNQTGTTLVMRDGEVHRKTLNGSVNVIRFDSYAFDLSELTQSRGQANLRAIDRDLTFLFNRTPTMPMSRRSRSTTAPSCTGG